MVVALVVPEVRQHNFRHVVTFLQNRQLRRNFFAGIAVLNKKFSGLAPAMCLIAMANAESLPVFKLIHVSAIAVCSA